MIGKWTEMEWKLEVDGCWSGVVSKWKLIKKWKVEQITSWDPILT